MTTVFINEIHYDNVSTDQGEFFEIAGPAGFDLTGWSVALYNGSATQRNVYNTIDLSGTVLTDQSGGYGTAAFQLPTNGIQNGAPDGIALVNNSGTVVEFLSYEGSFTAASGPAAGLTSTDIGVAESASTPIGFSLQREGTGTEAADFTFAAPADDTPGAVNTGQTFGDGSGDGSGGGGGDGGDGGDGGGGPSGPPPDVVINELRINVTGSESDYVELKAAPGTSLDGLSLVVVSGEFAPGQVDFAFDLTGLTVDDDGYILIRNADLASKIPQAVLQDTDLVADFNLFGSPSTVLLVQDFTGTRGADLDTDNNGTFDSSIGTVVDSVAFVDGDSNADLSYSPTIIGPDGSFTPAGAARDPDGTGAFRQLGFSDLSDDTPGTENFAAPPPTPALEAAIYTIQGAAHTSPLDGVKVKTEGIVTGVDSNGFYLQDATGDGDIATSDALFVFTGSAPGVAVGDQVQVTGTVSEFTPGGAATRNLSTTQIGSVEETVIVSSGNDLPTSVIIGAGGRILPTESIDDSPATFDPTEDAKDFWESLEGMRVTATDLVAVSGTSRFGEIFAVNDPDSFPLPDGGNQPFVDLYNQFVERFGDDPKKDKFLDKFLKKAGFSPEDLDGATGLSDRGTLNISPDDFNPEKIQIDEDSGLFNFDFPTVNTGAELGDVTGVVGYSFGNFEILPTEDFTPDITPSDLAPETSDIGLPTNNGKGKGADKGGLTVATYNVLNLDPNDSDGDQDVANGRFTTIAMQIENALNAPNIIALQEIQDSSGSANDGVTGADATLNLLTQEIFSATGIQYEWIDNTFITDNASGGQPGANIRTAFLYDPTQVSLVSGSVQTIGSQAAGEAFDGARLPLVATFTHEGSDITLVNVHFSSKGGSAPIVGTEQPFEERQEEIGINGSLDERLVQSQAVEDFVRSLGEDANVAVLGDFNEFEFISPVTNLLDAGLTNLTDTLPEDERYTFNFQGNSQSLDHILVSDALAADANFDVVHLNSEFAATSMRASDHDPVLVELFLPDQMMIA